jgi:hypothetical protein
MYSSSGPYTIITLWDSDVVFRPRTSAAKRAGPIPNRLLVRYDICEYIKAVLFLKDENEQRAESNFRKLIAEEFSRDANAVWNKRFWVDSSRSSSFDSGKIRARSITCSTSTHNIDGRKRLTRTHHIVKSFQLRWSKLESAQPGHAHTDCPKPRNRLPVLLMISIN